MLGKISVQFSEVLEAGSNHAHYLCNEGRREGFDAVLAAARLTSIAMALNEEGPSPLTEHFERLLGNVQKRNWALALDTLQGCAARAQSLGLRDAPVPVGRETEAFKDLCGPSNFR